MKDGERRGDKALHTDEVEGDVVVAEPPREVVEARSLLRRRDADPHYHRHTTRVAVGVRLGAGGRGCGGARPDHAASGGGSRARHVAQRG